MNIDLKGHDFPLDIIEEELKLQLKFFEIKDTAYPGFKKDMLALPMFAHCACGNCGDRISFKASDSGEDYVSETECAYKDGFPPIEAMLEVPSGEIILFNDLRKFYEEESPRSNINYMIGQKQYTDHFAKQGMIMHFIGNTCASVVQVSDERLEIGYFGCDKEEDCKYDTCPAPDCGFVEKNEIGSICTDLWWYCAVDKDAFEKRIGKTVDQYQKEYHATGAWPEVVRAKVTPGTYRSVGQYHIDDERLFSYIEKVK